MGEGLLGVGGRILLGLSCGGGVVGFIGGLVAREGVGVSFLMAVSRDAVEEAAEEGDDLVFVAGGWRERWDSRGGLIYHRDGWEWICPPSRGGMYGCFHLVGLDCRGCCCRTRGLHFIRHCHGHHLFHQNIHTPSPPGAVPCFAFLLSKRRGLFFVPPAKVCFLSIRDFGRDFCATGSTVLVDSMACAAKVLGVAALE